MKNNVPGAGLIILLLVVYGLSQGLSYPTLEYKPIGGKLWKITPDYPNPAPLPIPFNDQMVLEYTVLDGYKTNFRSGPAILDIIVKQVDVHNNNLNLAWLIHDINYEGYLGKRKVGRKLADQLLYAMLIRADISPIRAGAIYFGVRFFGRGHYSESANNPLIKFRKRSEKGFALKSNFPVFGMQISRLDFLTPDEKEKIAAEISELFPADAPNVIARMEKPDIDD